MRAERLITLMLLLHQHGRMTAQDLAEALNVSERTIYRDLESLSMAGIPVYAQSGVGGGIGLDEGYRVSLNGLNRHDIQALFVTQHTTALNDLGLTHANPLLKLMASLPQQHRQTVNQLQQRLYIDTTNWFQLQEGTSYLSELQRAVWDNYVLDMTYQAVEGAPQQRTLEPYGLVAKANIWYLVAKKPTAPLDAMRIYRVGRILSLAVQATPFERDATFDLGAFWQASAHMFEQTARTVLPPYLARLRVHPQAFWFFPAYCEGFYQVHDTHTDGWTELTVQFSDEREAIMRLLFLADGVQVLEPVALRDQLLGVARAIINQYDPIV